MWKVLAETDGGGLEWEFSRGFVPAIVNEQLTGRFKVLVNLTIHASKSRIEEEVWKHSSILNVARLRGGGLLPTFAMERLGADYIVIRVRC